MTKKTCPHCKGQGFRKIACGMDAYGDQDYYHGECPNCYGSGKVDNLTKEDLDDLETVRKECGNYER